MILLKIQIIFYKIPSHFPLVCIPYYYNKSDLKIGINYALQYERLIKFEFYDIKFYYE